MTQENVPSGKILFVDDHESIRHIFTIEAQRAGIPDFEVLEDAESAVKEIEELNETIEAVFSDGLNGGWKRVIAAAKEARIPVFIVSGDSSIQEEAEKAGAAFLLKPDDMKPGFIGNALGQLHPPIDTQ